jgi:hypothetical protein
LSLIGKNPAEMDPNLTGPKNQPPDSPELAREKIAVILTENTGDFSGIAGITPLNPFA